MASFSATSLPPGVEAGVDAGFFVLPPLHAGKPAPPFGGGLVAAARLHRPEVRTVPARHRQPHLGCGLGQSAEQHVPARERDLRPRAVPILRVLPCVVTLRVELWRASRDSMAAELWRLDASDLMLAPVGSTAFWRAMVDYLDEGPESAEGIEAGLEAAWPPDDPVRLSGWPPRSVSTPAARVG